MTNHRSNIMKRICVFCGTNAGSSPAFLRAADHLGTLLASRGIAIVYGGANVGLMGALADAALRAGGDVTGIIPRSLVEAEGSHTGLKDIRVVDSMHERKQLMHDLSDAFIALPGGLGTLEELFETLTWGQLGIHRKPVGVVNVERYFDPLLAMLDHGVDAGLVRPEHRALLLSETSAELLLARFAAYEAPVVERRLDRRQT